MWGRATSLASVAFASLLVQCGGKDPFACTDDSQCAAQGGVCGPAGYCAFPDASCASGYEYGEHAGQFSGMCVLDPVADTEAGNDDDDDDTDGASDSDGGTGSPVDTGEDTVGDDTVGDDDDDDTDGGPTLSFTDDELDGEFGEGTFDGTAWAGAVILDGTIGGTFTSRVFDAGEAVTWTALAWQPDAPYGRPLPDNEMPDAGYTNDVVDMSGNVLLLHLDDVDSFVDSSGHGNDPELQSGPGSGSGVFGGAMIDSEVSWLSIPISDGSDFQFGTDDFTWSLWVNTTDDCDGVDVGNNQVYIGTEDDGPERTHIWFGCVRPQSSTCDGEIDGGRAGGTFRSFHSNEDGTGYCGSTVITDGQWHHMAVVKEGHPNATISLFVDGQLEDQRGAAFDEPLSFVDNPDLTIGAFVGGSFPASGAFDEVAVWRRALDDGELRALWLRGVRRLGLQVRTCDQPDCSDDPPFFGDARGPFADTSQNGAQTSFDFGPAQYFQYSVDMGVEAGASSDSPRLLSVTVGANP